MLALMMMLAALAEPAPVPACESTLFTGMVACALSEFEQADAALNAQWTKMELEAPLRRAQRAWLKWRDAECDVRVAGGREDDLNRLNCLTALTKQRTQQLKDNYPFLER